MSKVTGVHVRYLNPFVTTTVIALTKVFSFIYTYYRIPGSYMGVQKRVTNPFKYSPFTNFDTDDTSCFRYVFALLFRLLTWVNNPGKV